MFRGKQLVIAGDSKQLRPNDLYRPRYEEDIEEDPALELDSVLDLAERYLMSIPLKGHYRSKSMDLIDFSNQHFYEGKLVLLPDRNHINKKEPSIQYIKTEGEWKNNKNEIEAIKVVEEVISILNKHPEKEIGIVTFNAPQQELIL
ncbi:MAG: DNA helicase I, partial [Cyclobacteriaceae bacterium]|nr:DNA helicase I [Cyclobacteriaceae bacterium]